MIEQFLQEWWPVLVGVVGVIVWSQRSTTNLEARVKTLEEKVKVSFELINRMTEREINRNQKKD